MKLKKHIYRPDDEIEIIEPLIVTRVGYPMSPEDARREVREKWAADIHALLVKVDLEKVYQSEDNWYGDPLSDMGSPAFERVVSALAYDYLAAKKFGGNQRTIHTQLDEGLRGKRARVLSKRNVKTGVRYPATGGMDYWGEYDYEPSSLRDYKTHVILEVQPCEDFSSPVEIEECHVRPFVAPWVAESISA